LTQQFYSSSASVCSAGNQIVWSWLNINNSNYQLRKSSGEVRVIEFIFSDKNTKFSITETDANDVVTISNFKKL
jgi:hypothetical protein